MAGLKALLSCSEYSIASKWSIDIICRAKCAEAADLLPSGPYFLQGNELNEAWRLHPDDLQCFQCGVIPDHAKPQYHFSALDSVIRTNQGTLVQQTAVPSRCYSRKTPKLPLSGCRVSIKENYDIAGLKTGLQNRSFFETYGIQTDTAEYVKRLIDLGAIIVGKTKLSSLVSGEKPCDWWEFQCPFNARADGGLNPGQSTTGGAASIGGYEWLDISIGSDSTGSVREPAAQNGVYGVRLTSSPSVPTKGLFCCAPSFDAIGFLGRGLGLVVEVVKVSTGRHAANSQKVVYPRKILYPTDFLPGRNKRQQQVYETTLRILEQFLDTKRVEINFADLWNEDPPPGAKGRSHKQFTKKLISNIFYYEAYHSFDSFRDDHRRLFNKNVYVSLHIQAEWDFSAQIHEDDYRASVADLDTFRAWFSRRILHPEDKGSSSAILFLPAGPGTPVYRDEFRTWVPQMGLFAMDIASAMGLPQIVFPVDQVPFWSERSGRQEYLPIAASIAGAKGSDYMIVKLVQSALAQAGLPTVVRPGRYAFDLPKESKVAV